MITRKDSPLGKQVLMRDRVREYLKDAIINGEIEPGTRIVETRLAKELGVSQSPVREALHDLEMSGMVVINPYQGTYVKRNTPEEIKEVYEVRMGMEKMALSDMVRAIDENDISDLHSILTDMIKAASSNEFDEYIKLDNRFHSRIVESSGNSFLIRLWSQMHMMDWIRTGTSIVQHENLEELASRHIKIYEAFAKKDKDATYEALEEHLEELLEMIYLRYREEDCEEE